MNNIAQTLIQTKDLDKIPPEEFDYFKIDGWRNCEGKDTPMYFEIFDNSLNGLGIKQGDLLEFTLNFNFQDFDSVFSFGFCYEKVSINRNLFIVSLDGGTIVARHVYADGENFLLCAANSVFPDFVLFSNEIDVIGKVSRVLRFTVK